MARFDQPIEPMTLGNMCESRCGNIGADARPNWQEQPPGETLTGMQWRN
jgi:hypothetical protein